MSAPKVHSDGEIALLIASHEKKLRLLDAPFEVKNAGAKDLPVMSGYVSTSSPDLANDIVEPTAFKDFLYRYKNNPVYLFQHDAYMPIGKVGSVSLDSKGLYLDDITLSDIPIVRDYISILVRDGVIKQQSIGFLSLDGEFDAKTGIYHHNEVYLLECSLVTVACNPEAGLDGIKSIPGFEAVKDMNDLVRLYKRGALPPLSKFKGGLLVPDLDRSPRAGVEEPPKKEGKELSDGQGIKAVAAGEAPCEYVEQGDNAIVVLPPRWHKDWRPAHEACFAAIRTVGEKESFILQKAVLTEKGPALSWPHVAVSMYRVMGAKSDFEIDPVQKAAIVRTLSAAYATLGKALPTVAKCDGAAVSDIDWAHAEVEFKDVEGHEGEDTLFELKSLIDDGDRMVALLNHYRKDGMSDSVKSVVRGVNRKFMGAYLDVFLFIEDAEDADKAKVLLDAMLPAVEPTDVEEDPQGAYTPDPAAAAAPTAESTKALLGALAMFQRAARPARGSE